ncbi:MAG: DNA-processing protein DprA, partial [Candidatus Sumerlaeota bacterium]
MNASRHCPIVGASLNDALLTDRIGNTLERAQLGLDFHWQGPIELCGAQPRVGIIGTRTPSPESEAAMERLAANLASHNAVIVSGAALGVDFAAHRGALHANGS